MAIIYLGVGWFVGLWLASQVKLSPTSWLLFGAAGLLGGPLARRRPTLFRLLLGLGAVGCGGFRYMSAVPLIDSTHIAYYNDGAQVILTGLVSDEPQIHDRFVDLRLQAEQITLSDMLSQPVLGAVLVRVRRFPVIEYGTRIEVRGLLETPEKGTDFDYRAYLARQGIHSIVLFPQVTELAGGQGSKIRHTILAFKQRARQTIGRLIPEPQAALLKGILLGDESDMAMDMEAAFQVTGLSHIIAISGFNVTILAGVLMRLSRAVMPRRAAVSATIAGIAIYTVLVGADASVVRAAIMGGIYLFTTRQLGRQAYAYASLIWSGLLMTLFNPLLLWNVGFQLSFSATLGLMLYAEPMSGWTRNRLMRILEEGKTNRMMRVINDAFLLTVAAQILALPLTAAYFGQVSLVSLPANLFVLPAQPGVMIWGGLATLTGMVVPAVGQLFGYVAWLFLAYTTGLVRLFAAMSGAAVPVNLNTATIIGIYGLIAAITWLSKQEPERRARLWERARPNLRQRWAIGAALAIAVLTVAWALTQPDGRLHVTFFDVGQGDAIFIQTPSGRQVLVDGGHYPTLLNQHLGQHLPFWDKEIDIMIATHPDADHVSGLPGVFERYRVGRLVTNGQEQGVSEVYDAVLLAAEEAGTELHPAVAGEVITIDDGVQMELLHPGAWLSTENRNDNSVCLRLQYGGFSLLLTGDAEEGAERQMVASGRPLSSLVFKAGHHGSRSSSNDFFLEAVRPQIIIISAGEGNRFGHPHDEVLQRAAEVGAAVLRTDELGTIEVVSDGQTMSWQAVH
jgi:competence protein ComEC